MNKDEVETLNDGNSSIDGCFETDCGGDSLNSFQHMPEKSLSRRQHMKRPMPCDGMSDSKRYASFKTEELGALLGPDIASEVCTILTDC